MTRTTYKSLLAKSQTLIGLKDVSEVDFGHDDGTGAFFLEYTHKGNHYHLKALTTGKLHALFNKVIKDPTSPYPA